MSKISDGEMFRNWLIYGAFGWLVVFLILEIIKMGITQSIITICAALPVIILAITFLVIVIKED